MTDAHIYFGKKRLFCGMDRTVLFLSFFRFKVRNALWEDVTQEKL